MVLLQGFVGYDLGGFSSVIKVLFGDSVLKKIGLFA